MLLSLGMFFVSLEPSTMVLSTSETSPMKTHKKRPFENHARHQYQCFPPNFNCPRVDAVRDWPRGCGKFISLTDSKVIGDNIAVGTAGNFQAPVEHSIQSSFSSTIDAEVRRHEVPRSYPPKEVLKSYSIVRDFPEGLKSASSSANNISPSEKFSAEPRPVEVMATCTQSPGQEMQDESAYNGALARRSYEGSNEVWNSFGGEVGETSGFVGKWAGDAKEVCILLGQEIQDGDSFGSALKTSACKETGNEVWNDCSRDFETYGVEGKWGVDAKEICTSLGQEIQGGEACNRTLERSPWEATINEVQNSSRDGETSGFMVRRDDDTKEISIHPQSERKLSELDPWCQTVGNKDDQGKNVLRNTGKEIEICSKDQISKDHQAIGNNSRVQGALNLFQELLEKLRREAILTGKKNVLRKLPVTAAMTLKRQQKWVNTTKRLGHVSGIEVGDTFCYRVELAIIGLHSHFQNGIDYMEKDGKVLAISVVDSGRYANDKESSDVLIYLGQGGNPMVGYNKQPEDQKLERGNLALKNSMDAKTPVRVTRGFQAMKVTSNGYTYDGLYFVDKYWQERGQFGKLVFKFQLKRITGEPKFDQRELNQSKDSEVRWKTIFNDISHGRKLKKSKKSEVCRKNILNDISLGKEERPIHVVNTIDYEKPQPFTYIARMTYLESSKWSIPSGCDCTDGCSDSVKCACVLKNGGEIPFNCHGAIIETKPWVYECGPLCKCPPSCNNRVSQNGIRFSLEVFKTKSTGWGVRSRNYISSGSFICEYAGELIQDKEAKRRTANDEYLFDLDNGAFAIDAAKFGNVGRFINHSCSPNLYAQKVLYDHDDKRLPHIMLFATKNIPPMRELTYHYNYMVGQVLDINGQIKTKRCYCGSQECKGRMC